MMSLEKALDLGILSKEDLQYSINDIRKAFNIPLTVPDEMIYSIVANDILDRYFSQEYISEESVNELMGQWE